MSKKNKINLNEDFDKDDLLRCLKNDKDIEKRVRQIVTNVVTDLFKVLWQKKSTYETSLY